MSQKGGWMDPANNPCTEEAKASYKCLDVNNYDKSMCQEFFDAYKDCKRQWNARKAEERRRKFQSS
ncbi:Cytochrome c oxidase-assembly factor COX23, mitochondrial [Trichoplax sp. H2]|nr:Cytochrome c oxidase-assembly factor COX23, mitochondrial [Trichoplax sp. H2]|eukprot:RDD43342.1 Cytochrome c oxidase-assembly factor COX23, mitochondrial [Trichoplax sp. H2]